ncbi:hypothetical protein FEM48_Zijuj08G0161200 [Ziziphus jujuba var. spinosa]|uniref:CG-1 domain-containing protein n=1 Tax=Ziziphus jujuba var. spinosa TaxID=714518 RepID=A0A978V024_ZIZJJ|nr:hypothetical protein FEM48_Zijuj08G0161200 [Ziziphus jujuba var. spinosa]
MAESRRYGLDIEQILMEAQHRWLRPAEICEILRNYKRFRIAPEPANMPPSGSLFLFDRKVLRYFRKDGHNWRKKKDGKTVKEAHERLKAGSIDVLHCYYAHGEDNENFQRRSYWMLEEDLSHIVLVHYREVKGNRTSFNRIRENEDAETAPNSEIDSSFSSSFPPNSYQISQTTDTTSLNSAQASEYEDAESAYNQASSTLHSFLELQRPMAEQINSGLSDPYYPMMFSNDYQGKSSAIPGIDISSLPQTDINEGSKSVGVTYEPRKNLDFPLRKNILVNTSAGTQSLPLQPSLSAIQSENLGIVQKQEQENFGQLFSEGIGQRLEFGSQPQVQEEWQASGGHSSSLSKWPADQNLHQDAASNLASERETNGVELLQSQHPNTQHEYDLKSVQENNVFLEGKPNYISGIKQSLLDSSFTDEGLKKLDSFNRWMSKELGDVNESHMQTSSEAYWDTVEAENADGDSSQVRLDTYMLGPSLSQDQLFTIIDFSPNWAFEDSEVKVLITGRFLDHQAESSKWSCMFGEVEVPAEVIADGVLRCHTPIHKAGRVPFYVTCSNRLACSEVREFEYRVNEVRDMDLKYDDSSCTTEELNLRFGKLLCLDSACPTSGPNNLVEKSQLSSKISLLLREDEDEWDQMLKLTSENNFSVERVEEQLHQKLLKGKLHGWLLQKVAEGGKGASVVDEGGQGVLHFAAALDYDWALEPTIIAGVSVNFRDVNGWTALHWAAFCGRERTVASLISLGAAPGALTDPSPKYQTGGKTPSDLAYAKGHKGIAGYLAESALSAHLLSLNLDKKEGNAAETSGVKAVHTISERVATPVKDGDLNDRLSLKDSLAAVCNATQAAARIHQVFRVQSFQRKQLKEYGDDKFGMSDEQALSLIAVKSAKQGHHDEHVNAAAIRIQNKFRSWKGRKDFLIIRQRIVKIQAHVRGHQVRKNYRKITWSVGIVEKIILRWRRKGSGLRGFKSEALTEGPSKENSLSKEDDDDFLKEGRKQAEVRLQKALNRVKSMVQYPEARDQYRRLLNVVSEFQGTKVQFDTDPNNSETADFDDDLIDLEALLDEDTYMPTA